nr:hypothetical protein [Tanacetum cinerariifolium]
RRHKQVKSVGLSKKSKIVESKIANKSEPTHLWGSNAIDVPSSSSLVNDRLFRFFSGIEESPKTPHFHDDLLYESLHEDSTSQGSSSNMRPSHTPFEHLGRWTKDHSIANVIEYPSRFVFMRKKLKYNAMWCYFDAFLTSVEPKNFIQAMTKPKCRQYEYDDLPNGRQNGFLKWQSQGRGIEESPKIPHFHDDLLYESLHDDSTSQGSSSNMRPSHTPFKHLGRWTKDHSIANVIGYPSRSVFMRKKLKSNAMWCYFDAFLTSVEPKNFIQAMTKPS